jgi:eukaryotic-like serine/threonine-protein kinase
MSEIDRPLKNLNPKLSELKSESSNAPTLDSVDGGLVSGSTQYPATGTVEQRSIGRYLLLKKLGEGGMGQVWLAEQTAPVRRQVALKLIKAGMCDETMLHRFQSERQSLAIMDHPSIAKVFDAGATPDGQPYFVMEYVPGLPITEYCDHKRLNIRERLELFIQACEGVQHAHQKAIIHRDLKPANVLVVEVDGKPMSRIIDFGLARAATPHAFGETTFTQVGAPIGTPAYMSPEQADPEGRDVDTRTDVYSLGVLLYELLTGMLPFDPKQWQNKPFDYVLRQLREEYPLRPSIQFNKKVSTHCEAATVGADLRGTDPKRLVKLLRGDLDWITMKALEKDRGRRYGTPSELASEIGRFLQNQPVMARPPSTGYRLQKYVRRHRVEVAAAVGLVLLLTGFMVTQAVQLRRITQERDRTTRERDRANRITDFMTGMFKVSDPSEARGVTITAREVLDKASKDIDTGLAKDPELQTQMMNVMGNVYNNLGLYSRADTLLTRTVEIRRRILGPEHPDTLMSMSNLALLLRDEGHYAEAEKLAREVVDVQRRILGPNHPDTLMSMSNLAVILWREGRFVEAEKLDRETLDIRRRILGPDHPDTLMSMNNLAILLDEEGRYIEAETLGREALDVQRRVLGPEHPDTLISMINLAGEIGDEGRYSEAEKLYREAVDTSHRVLGPEHPNTLVYVNNLADCLTKMGKYAEAVELLRSILPIERRVLGPEHPYTAASVYGLGSIAARQGHRDEAFLLLRQAIDHGLYPVGDLHIEEDPDLKSLHSDPRFAALVNHAKERAAAVQKPN